MNKDEARSEAIKYMTSLVNNDEISVGITHIHNSQRKAYIVVVGHFDNRNKWFYYEETEYQKRGDVDKKMDKLEARENAIQYVMGLITSGEKYFSFEHIDGEFYRIYVLSCSSKDKFFYYQKIEYPKRGDVLIVCNVGTAKSIRIASGEMKKCSVLCYGDGCVDGPIYTWNKWEKIGHIDLEGEENGQDI